MTIRVLLVDDVVDVRRLVRTSLRFRGGFDVVAEASDGAEAVRQFLTGFGISADRFEIVSFGEDRPLAQGSNEQAWARNRRAVMIYR